MRRELLKRAFAAIVITLLCNLGVVVAAWMPLNAATPAEPMATLLSADVSQLTLRWELAGVRLEAVQTTQGEFTRLDFGDHLQIGASPAGSPFLPTSTQIISVPSGMRPAVEVTDVQWTTLGSYRLHPMQPPTRDNGAPAPAFQYDPAAYTSNEPIPSQIASVGAVQGWGGMGVAAVGVTPFRYIPATGELQAAASLTVRVNFLPGGRNDLITTSRPGKYLTQSWQNVVINPPANLFDADENEPERMLFIMLEEAQEAAQPLIDFHQSTGLHPQVWLVENDIEPEEIKDRIIDEFEEGLQYVFIIGDAYHREPDVPMFYWDPIDPPVRLADTDTHSDYWYVCLDPEDDEGFDDHLPELAIGRLTYDDIEELEIQVDKLMRYMEGEIADRDNFNWLSQAILVASDDLEQDEPHAPIYIECKEAVRNHQYQLQAPEWTRMYGDDEGASNQAIIDFINERGVGLVNYRGHGNRNTWASWDGWSSFSHAQARALQNEETPFIMVSSACENADVADTQSNCLLETFLKNPDGGPAAAHGSIISSWTPANTFFDIHIFRAFFDDGVYALAYASNQANVEMIASFSRANNYTWPTVGRMNARTYIWLGDPALELRDRAPINLAVDVPELVLPEEDRISFTVFSGEEPVEGVRVTARTEDDEVYVVGYTNEQGIALLEFDPPLEQGTRLLWRAYHRNATQPSGAIVVTEGYGMVFGRVSTLTGDESLPDVEVLMLPFEAHAITNQAGQYHFAGIPAMQVEMRVSPPGYLAQSRIVDVQEDDSIEVDFAIRFAQLALDSNQVAQHLDPEQQVERHVSLHNTGDGELEWTAAMQYAGDRELYEEIYAFDIWEEVNDQKLYGVEFIDGHFYVAGGHNNLDPNYIYKLNSDGFLVDVFQQPEASIGIGIRDLAWDGQYLYGSSNDNSIFVMNLDGTEAEAPIPGPYAPTTALTADDDGNLWAGRGTGDLVLINSLGDELDRIDADLNVTSLGWLPNELDGYDLQIFVLGDIGNEESPVLLYQANPSTREVRFAADLAVDNSEMAGNGLCVTGELEENEWSLVGLVNRDREPRIKVWNLGYPTGWLEVEPLEGAIEADSRIDLTLRFDAIFDADILLRANLHFESNGMAPTVDLPILLVIGDVQAVEQPEDAAQLPAQFSIGAIHPNPFNAVTIIPVNLNRATNLQVDLFDLQGRKVLGLTDAPYPAGRHNLELDGSALQSGVYLLRVTTDMGIRTAKVAMVK